jgi:hypothetical protein
MVVLFDIFDKNVPLSQISSQQIVGVQIQPLIAILQANLMLTKPLIGCPSFAIGFPTHSILMYIS